ncbi:hypothetical protein BDQ12DRAFT_722537 [Crucibulum laeve]|uniref:Uncharacterized protein n=1 Tax=Crucibulum laeve TaxID=68775 RepID=A0A5C3M196_9AGAR|nr:hypothetical protein BDQ12DRAFT_722537 [Crucibulum laeve]
MLNQKELEKKGFCSVIDWFGPAKKNDSPIQEQQMVPQIELQIEPELEYVPSDENLEENHAIPNDEIENSVLDGDQMLTPAQQVEAMLQNLHKGRIPLHDYSLESTSDLALNQLHYKNFPALQKAAAELKVKSADKTLDIFFRACIMAMCGTLSLYLDSELMYTWCEASLIVSKSQGSIHFTTMVNCAQQFLKMRTSPRLSSFTCRVLQRTATFAQDIVDYIASPKMQKKLEEGSIKKELISLRTAQCWLNTMGWQYGKKKNGMYIDGHEQEDVVAYRNAFIEWFKAYEKRMVKYDNDGNISSIPEGFPVPTGQ